MLTLPHYLPADKKQSIQDVWNDIVSSEDEDEENDGSMKPPSTLMEKVQGAKNAAKGNSMNDDDTQSVMSSKFGGSSKEKLARDEQSFPDEVDTPEDGLAKIRFQRCATHTRTYPKYTKNAYMYHTRRTKGGTNNAQDTNTSKPEHE